MQANRKNKKRFRSIAILVITMAVVCSSGLYQLGGSPAYAADENAPAADAKAPSADAKAPAADAKASPNDASASSKAAAKSDPDIGKQLMTFHVDQLEPYYLDVMADWEKKGYKNATSQVLIPGAQISAQSDKYAAPGTYDGKNNVLVWTSEKDNWIEYQVNVPQDGLYQMDLSYHLYKKPGSTDMNRRAVQLQMQVDGTYQFREARALPFRGLYKDELPLKKDVNGDNIRPKPLEIDQWITSPIEDTGGAYNEPLKWYLTKGQHTLRLSAFDPIVIESLKLVPPTSVESYDKVAAKYPATQASSKEVTTLQAEDVTSKNDVSIQILSDQDPLMVPKANGNDIFNSIGGTRWEIGGQTVNYKFSVPESGKYKIALREKQSFLSNLSSYRKIEIDGKVPFSELLAYRFNYSPNWKGLALQGDDQKPFEFYLEKGEHEISLTATTAPFQPVIVKSDQITTALQLVDQELQAMTGGVVDKNRTWKINEDFPELPQQLQTVHDQLNDMANEMLKANGKRDSTVQTIKSAMDNITDYLSYPDEIPYHIDDIATLEQNIGTIRETLSNAPLQIDQIYIAPSGAEFPKMQANLFEKIGGTVHNFFYSFVKKDDISNLDPNSLNVWVNRGRDYVNELQELSDEMFTPETGIKVKVNLLPNENLLILANAAGLTPDVALGQPQDKSIDFAMRNALYDLTQFPDFNEVKNQFSPGAMMPFFYNGGYYALPETQSFKVLFYRKDILQKLGLGIPDTWDEVFDMLPTLQQNGYNFNIPAGDWAPFIFENGADFFTKDGMKTALDSPEAFKGFKMFTDLFNIYDVDKQANFYQHLRKGDMPIGVGDYNEYLKLAAAAPELTGWWGIAPLPGIKQPDGSVVRWAAGGQQTAFMYKRSQKKDQAWKFIKWWLSADVQERYGLDLESFNGITFRWNTANVEAMTRLPWPKADAQVILQQWKWYKEIPNLPGSYYVGREMNNAWNRTVVDGMNYRESLEEAIVNINREMLRKEQEFGFVDKNGKVQHTLDLPQVTKPWEGVDKYVR